MPASRPIACSVHARSLRATSDMRCRVSAWGSDGLNRIPPMTPAGCLIHRRISAVRAGRLERNVAAWASTRRLDVRSSGRTRILEAWTAVQPRGCAISGPRRVFRSSPASIACMSGTTDFTSTTSRTPVPGWKPRTSIEPRCPRRSKVTSATASQRLASRIAIARSTRSACRASVNRSSPSPCHRSRTSTRASSAPATRISVRTVTRSARPRSIREMTLGETPTADASRCCVHRRRRRSARTPSPNRTTSMVQGWAGPLTRWSSPAGPRVRGSPRCAPSRVFRSSSLRVLGIAPPRFHGSRTLGISASFASGGS